MEIKKYGPGAHQIEFDDHHDLRMIVVEHNKHNDRRTEPRIWIEIDGIKGVDAFAWLSVDEAEAIVLAILDAIKESKMEES